MSVLEFLYFADSCLMDFKPLNDQKNTQQMLVLTHYIPFADVITYQTTRGLMA